MNCPYCNNDLNLPEYKEGKRYISIKCLHCPSTSFAVDNQLQIILHVYIYLDECNASNGRMITVTPMFNTAHLQRFDPHGDSYVIMETTMPKDLAPNNAHEYWDRLTNLMVFL